jgi:hypothetical protein
LLLGSSLVIFSCNFLPKMISRLSIVIDWIIRILEPGTY